MVKKMKIGAIIQARLGSSRLPNKVLFGLPFGSGKTLLEHIISRAEAANVFNQIIVATTTEKTDDPIVALLEARNIPFFRGSEDNVLDRYYQAASENELNVIVRLTADNPCIDPESLKKTVHFHLEGKYDCTKTTGLPLGMNLEVFSFKALKMAHEKTTKPEEKEHVTAHFYTNPEAFKIGVLPFEFAEESFRELRVTVDYPSDLALVNLLYSYFKAENNFSVEKLYEFWQNTPWITEINKNNFQKKVYTEFREELHDAISMLKFYNFDRSADLLTQRLDQ